MPLGSGGRLVVGDLKVTRPGVRAADRVGLNLYRVQVRAFERVGELLNHRVLVHEAVHAGHFLELALGIGLRRNEKQRCQQCENDNDVLHVCEFLLCL